MFRKLSGSRRRRARVVKANQAKRRQERSYTVQFTKWARSQHGTTKISGVEIIGEKGTQRQTKEQTAAQLKRLLQRKGK